MRTFSFDISSADDLARLFTVTKVNGDVLRFTDAQIAITIDGNTWTPQPGVLTTAMQFADNADVDSCQAQIWALESGIIAPGEVSDGLLDGLTATVSVCNQNVQSGDTATLLIDGYLGANAELESGLVTLEFRSAMGRGRSIVTEKFSPTCRADLGDKRCRVAILPADQSRNKTYTTRDLATSVDEDITGYATRVSSDGSGLPASYNDVVFWCTTPGTTAGSAPVYDYTLGNTTTDGSAVFTAMDAWLRAAVVNTVPTGQSFTLTGLPDARAVDGWFTLGGAIVRSGITAGFCAPVSNWENGTLTVHTFMDITNQVHPGDLIEIFPGCDKTSITCNDVYDNMINQRAEQYVPGRDLMLTGSA